MAIHAILAQMRISRRFKLLLSLLSLLLAGALLLLFGCIIYHPNPLAPPGPRIPEYADFLTVKYDTNGNQVWVKLFNQSEDNKNRPVAVNLDKSGNIYVSGTSFKYTEKGMLGGYATVKYDSAGQQIWVASYDTALPNSTIFARAATIDEAGNIYVTGSSPEPTGKYDVTTVKYDSNGRELWVVRYRQPGSESSDPSAIALDKAGNVYITGTFYIDIATTNSDYFTLKYDSQGNLLWEVSYDGPAHSTDIASKLAVDDIGNVYATGKSGTNSTFNFDYATVKYDTYGKELWVARYSGNSYNEPHDLKLDSKGNVIITGESAGSDGMRQYATIKYNSDGQELWVARYSGAEGKASAMAIDNEGNVYVTGESSNYPNGSDYATVKYDSNGHELWVARYKGSAAGLHGASALFIDSDSNVYVTGHSTNSNEYSTYNTIKYDPNGNIIWVTQYSGLFFADVPVGLVVDPYGNVFVSGPVSRFGRNND